MLTLGSFVHTENYYIFKITQGRRKDSGGSGQAEHLDFGHREGCVELWHYLIGFTEMSHNQGLHL